jgi:DNA (cytosine-5)-methyltransferase 1
MQMTRPLLIDLFCCAGGAGMGYHRAGFDVLGVDISPQPNYPFRFEQADALEWLRWEFTLPLNERAAVYHASPPCQRHSAITSVSGDPSSHPDLIGSVRDFLVALGRPYIIENVPRAPLRDPVLMCGAAMGLRHGPYVLRRHRLFESNVALTSPGCGCRRGDGITMGVYGGGNSTKPRATKTGGRPYKGTVEERKAIMGMPWVGGLHEINEAIPPAYTEYLGKQLLSHVQQRAAA